MEFEFASSSETFSVREFSAHEQMSTPFDLDVIAVSTNPAVDLAELRSADAADLDLHTHLPKGELGEFDLVHHQGLVLLDQNRGSRLHVDFTPTRRR